MDDILETDKAYIAGLFDGEGSISITLKLEDGRSKYRIRKNLTITNTDKAVLEWIRATVGYGSIYTKVGMKKSTRIGFDYSVQNSSEIVDFLLNIIPYVKVKIGEVQIALDIINTRLNALSEDYHAPVTDYENFLVEQLAEERR